VFNATIFSEEALELLDILSNRRHPAGAHGVKHEFFLARPERWLRYGKKRLWLGLDGHVPLLFGTA
jgi:hypothetical protein